MKKGILIFLAIVLNTVAFSCTFLPTCGVPVSTSVMSVGQHISRLTLHEDDLYFGAGYCLYRLSTDEQNLREITCVTNWLFQQPAIDRNLAYSQVSTAEGETPFVAVDISTGETVWHFDEPEGIGTGFRDAKDYIYLVNDRVVTLRGEQFKSETRVCAFASQSGNKIWCADRNYHQSKAIPFLVDNSLVWYVIEKGKDEPENGLLVGIDVATGEPRQIVDLRPSTTFDELLYIDSSWLLGMDGGYIVAVDRTRPDELAWRSSSLALGTADTDQITTFGDLFIVPSGGTVYAIKMQTGQTEWAVDPEIGGTVATGSEHIVLFVLSNLQGHTLYALDAVSGAEVWRYELSPSKANSAGYVPPDSPPRPIVSGDVVYIANGNSVDALNLLTGELLWQVYLDSEYEYHFDPF